MGDNGIAGTRNEKERKKCNNTAKANPTGLDHRQERG